jgi:ATP-dependent DNA helicase DinG
MVNYGHDIEKWIDFLIELQTQMFDLTGNVSEELAVEATRDTEKLTQAINNILSNPKNWIVSEVTGVELKPLDVSPYCKDVFQKCAKTLMMSATILDSNTFCQV